MLRTKVVDIYNELKGYGMDVFVYDPYVKKEEAYKTYGISLIQRPESKKPFDGIIIAVKHSEYRKYTLGDLRKLCNGKPVMMDIKAFFDKGPAVKAGFRYWRL